MQRQELKQKQIAVLMGGLSAERDVSLRTGRAIGQALQRCGYQIVEIDAGRDLPAQLERAGAEVVFIALHGRFGEDGTVQGLLELCGIPYTGSGVLASSLAMDKVATKKMLCYHGIVTPAFAELRQGDVIADNLPDYPLVVKPAREGSTIGISIANDRRALEEGLAEAFRHDDLVLVEQFIAGAEVTVGVLDGQPLPVIQVVPKGGFYDYQSKYTPGETEYLLPAPLPEATYLALQEAAVRVFRAVGCQGAARVDFMVTDTDFYCLEVNTIPGMTETSLLPKAAQAAGLSFDELVERILEGAALRK
ncbi:MULTISPECIES: D-alanine--D-alanine ligase [Syntrophotalea]|uniref:D-alanine--D-alanine ligase n=1 Tax=Syntrophotalea acetylenica TaxID=29542 RepID=A0A1L3GHM4_SYNAC|nr:D-alanine--D-alanine ligase [Syntrophotalea acetylenica]APG25365.1 D-alanine--D-alanine ligase [Syntrophotalea acetylenica]APG43433.1 D-alanine--D-alanine ligase [Syntrophotalea acetylenica]MDY0262620.1 D-alanine--D-alanine ligase [Syntrophotalea acetylenica]